MKEIQSLQIEDIAQASIQQYQLQPTEQLQSRSNSNCIAFVLVGSILLDLDSHTLPIMSSKQMLFIKALTPYRIRAQDKTVLMLIDTGSFSLPYQVLFMDKPPLDRGNMGEPILKFTPLITHFAATLKAAMVHDFSNTDYINIKVNELFFLINSSYTARQRSNLFWGGQSSDRIFFSFVIHTYKKAGNVKTLAKMASYSLSGFEKRFKKVFNTSPAQWFKDRKASDIYMEVCDAVKSFKEISVEYGFCSPAHFNVFCKARLGDTPGKLRQEVLLGLHLAQKEK